MPGTKQLITWQRINAAGELDTLYPKTTASQVFINAGETETLTDHVSSSIHLTAAERQALTATNQASGYVQLDSNGQIPRGLINPADIAVKTEFATTAAMFDGVADVKDGQIVMVVDASGDVTVDNGWAMYRKRTGTGLNFNTLNTPAVYSAATGTYVSGTTYYTDANGSANVDTTEFVEGTTDVSSYFVQTAAAVTNSGWQKIAEGESLDVVVSWDSITGKPNSTPAAIDQAVADDHTHSNKAVIDKFTDIGTSEAPVLKYGTKTVAFSDDVIVIQVTTASQAATVAAGLKEGDMLLVTADPVEP